MYGEKSIAMIALWCLASSNHGCLSLMPETQLIVAYVMQLPYLCIQCIVVYVTHIHVQIYTNVYTTNHRDNHNYMYLVKYCILTTSLSNMFVFVDLNIFDSCMLIRYFLFLYSKNNINIYNMYMYRYMYIYI